MLYLYFIYYILILYNNVFIGDFRGTVCVFYTMDQYIGRTRYSPFVEYISYEM